MCADVIANLLEASQRWKICYGVGEDDIAGMRQTRRHPGHVLLGYSDIDVAVGELFGKWLQDRISEVAGEEPYIRLLSMHTVKPLDEPAVREAALAYDTIVTVEEHSVTNGLGSAVADVLATMRHRRATLVKYGVPDALYDRVGSQAYMRELAGDLTNVVEGALRLR